MNTQNLSELETSFKLIVNKYNAEIFDGIEQGHVKREDGLPWFEVYGKFTRTSVKNFIQDLADAMDIKVLFNRSEWSGEGTSIYGVFDINPDIENTNQALPPYSELPDAVEFMEDYGKEFYPKSFKKSTQKKKTASI